ncbi:PSD1 and planctomycete cytochrome C domain-containing protein [Planctomicrobium sp. SH668]|uniref:PSD1 and planctomycete cytochrome C domain-containing protein n=1 Tax=Planctomicrobium sp. SH668 TaxID=3448126 RepID=UPI003F5B6273
MQITLPRVTVWTLRAQPYRQPVLGRLTAIAVLVFCSLVFNCELCSSVAIASGPSEEDVKFFENKIRPLLIEKCADCHGADTQESGLRMDTYAGMFGGGTSGPAVIANDAEGSLLVAAINYKDPNLQMPPDQKLSDAEIALITEWIQRGAPHPEQDAGGAAPRVGAINLEESRKFWSFRPVDTSSIKRDPSIPFAKVIDDIVNEELTSKGLVPNAPADKRTLIRRVMFDLTGLPPTPEEVNNFLADESPEAYERLVDEVLSRPQYGERWARHWLGVARYADSNGQDENLAHLDAWRYRNYVIDAFNADKPFDLFLKEQLAGDLMVDGKTPEEVNNLRIATGFLSLGPKVLAEVDKVKMEMDIIDEQIATIGEAVLGLTIACARCHDHKFDPIYTADYYALAGILKSTKTMESFATIGKYNEHILLSDEEISALKQEAQSKFDEAKAAKQSEIDAAVATATTALQEADPVSESLTVEEKEANFSEETKAQLKILRDELAKIQLVEPTYPTAMGVKEGTVSNLKIHVRGSHMTLGRQVDRGIPEILKTSGELPIAETSSGRKELADWLTSPEHPLTARVAVNRIWRWHFGKGIVETTENFGRLGVPPTNPALLDALAAEFINNGWSVKELNRQILLSETYRRSSQDNLANAAIDPANVSLWRFNVLRIESELIRDSLLAVSGTIDLSQGSAMLTVPKWQLVFDHTSKDATTYDTNRRSIYLPVIRNNMYDVFSLFDYSNADVVSGGREVSTVAPQALFVMNSEMFLTAAEKFVERGFEEVPNDDTARIHRLYELALGRPPESHEAERFLRSVQDFIESIQQTDPSADAVKLAWQIACQAILSSNEFFYIN